MNNIFEFLNQSVNCELLIVNDDKQALSASYLASYKGLKPFILSDFRANFGDDLVSFSQELKEIIKQLQEYYNYPKKNRILIAPIRTISFALPKKECFDFINIEFASTINIKQLKTTLHNWGYYFVDIVTSNGEVSFRGDIIDICTLNDDIGYRISLFDTEIENIREFDLQTQKSIKNDIENIKIYPAFLSLDENNFQNLNKKIQDIPTDSFIKDIHSLGFWALDELAHYLPINLNSYMTYQAYHEISEAYIFQEKRLDKKILSNIKVIPNAKEYKEVSSSTINNSNNIKDLLQFHENKKITIISSTQAQIKRYDLELNKNINYILKPYIINLISQDQLIISLNKPTIKRKKRKITLLLDELKIGDLVVHEKYGIGKFKSIKPISILSSKKDFIEILYANDNILLLPIENIDLLHRYIAHDLSNETLDTLGKNSFSKLKSKVQDKLYIIADNIIKLAASRQITNAPIIKIDQKLLNDFQLSAGFEYTKDQLKCIKDIFKDISSNQAMDRLLCGDVGFGKTEVALNAILASIISGYQVFFTCPTTLLAYQHYHSIKKRFDKYNFNIVKLDSKTSTKDKNYIKNELLNGNINLIIGTHSLLNIKAKNLGLLIIDEEHKFGVKQKEKLKQITKNTHIFSMSATPIPRTLNLALSKIKGMSSLLTPPTNRLGVRTYLKEYNEKIIKEIILREKRRGGQVFYIHNNIKSIKNKKLDLESILPNIKIDIVHSQINSIQTQNIIEKFDKGDIDILLATSIIESGIHLPNANSIIIEQANKFGIADLHQLRGRVGRSNKEGFCYLIVEDKNKINSDAIKRLVALENNSYLGSGNALAHQDLEIRGGGNIIGDAQSGHIKQIGYGLYLKMLEDTLSKMTQNSQTTIKKEHVDIKLNINAYISNDYIYEDRVRLELYRRLSKCLCKNDIYDIQHECEDRFGKFDIPTKQFFELIMIKLLALNKSIKLITNYETNISFTSSNDIKVNIKSSSKDDDDIIKATLQYLRK